MLTPRHNLTPGMARHILVLQCLPEWVREVKFVMELAEYTKLSPSSSAYASCRVAEGFLVCLP